MTYAVESLLPGQTVAFDEGTSLLVSGPSMVAEGHVLDAVAEGPPSGETAVVITTNTAAGEVLARFEDRGPVDGRLGIIDCTTREGGGNAGEVEAVPVEHLSSPGDLTGISLEFAKLVSRFEETGNGDAIRVGLSSISTMLMYTDVQTAFRFLHVFTSRIRSGGQFGVFSIDSGMHEDQTVNTVRAIFDAEARVTDDGDVDLRGSGYRIE